MNKKIKIEIAVGIIVVVAIVVGVSVWHESKEIREIKEVKIEHPNSDISSDKGIICTQDAKQCADGSYVSRKGPNCEFAACPETNNDCAKEGESIGAVVPGVVPKKCCNGLSPIVPQGIVGTQGICQKVSNETSGWRTYINNQFGIQFKYPSKLKMEEDISRSASRPKILTFVVQLLPLDEKNFLFLEDSGNQGDYQMGMNADMNIGVDRFQQKINENKYDSVVIGDTGIKWYCEKSVTLQGADTKTCWALNTKGYVDQIGFDFSKIKTLLSESEFDNIIKSLNYTK